jgi:hypothetical protein
MNTYLEIVVTKTEKVEKRFTLSGKSKEEMKKIYDEKSKTLAKTKFMRIINAEEELKSTELKKTNKKKK